MQIFLQYCYSAILPLELHCSTILKLNISFLLHRFSLSFSPLSLTPTLSLCLPLLAKSLFLSVLTLSLISYLSFSFKAYTGVGLGSWFDLGMVVGWDWLMVGLDWRAGFAGDGSNGFDKGLNRRGWVAGDGSDGFDRGLNRRGWVAVFDRGLLCCAWSARSRSCLVSEVWVLNFGRRGSRSGFLFFLIWVFVPVGF